MSKFEKLYDRVNAERWAHPELPSYEVYNRAFNLKEVGSASAVAVVLTVLVFLINVVVSRIGEEKR